MDKLPFELGYRMPAEWSRHESTWLSWPKDPESFPEEILPEVEATYIKMIDVLHKNEKVNLLVDDEIAEKRVAGILASKKINRNITIHKIKTADVWFRDYGPIFINRNGGKGENGIAFTHWKFNAWGNKYYELEQDAHVPEKLPLTAKSFDAPMVLEGGSIDVNGLGACLTTEQCLLNKNRNPSLGRGEIERNLHDYLGVTKTIWLRSGIEGDDTDGHVDDVARFVDEKTVVCALEGNKADENREALEENSELLSKAMDQDGKKFRIISLPMPEPVVYKSQRLPASYTNFYIANGAVLVPTFKDKNDRKALEILQGLFPGRQAVGINCRELVYGFGAVHCVTQQQPDVNKL